MVGQTYRVLVEDAADTQGVLMGRTSGNVIVEFEGDNSLIGNFAYAEITQARNWILKGQLAVN